MSHYPVQLNWPAWRWDIFCTVIDNHGDIGVCWRLASHLAQRGQRVRLWVDDTSSLQWMAPQGCPGVEVRTWQRPLAPEALPEPPADVLIEAFGCTLDDAVQAHWAQAHARGHRGLWLNLEYLSAEAYVSRCHLLPSPLAHGPVAGHSKLFFYPGFAPETGGLLWEVDLLQRQQAFRRTPWLKQWGLDEQLPVQLLFCYEPAALPDWLRQMAQQSRPVQMLVAPGRPYAAVQAALPPNLRAAWQGNGYVQYGTCRLIALPWLAQQEFDHALWASTLNFVRGEDSLVRALWAGQPLVWHIYPQHDHAHHAKLEAWLDWMQAPADVRHFHRVWNGMQAGMLPIVDWQAWQVCVQQACQRALQQAPLAEQLLQLAARHLLPVVSVTI